MLLQHYRVIAEELCRSPSKSCRAETSTRRARLPRLLVLPLECPNERDPLPLELTLLLLLHYRRRQRRRRPLGYQHDANRNKYSLESS
jgi:hypothetical protein